MEESDWWPWNRCSDLCLRNAANDDDLFTFTVPETVSGLFPEEAEEKWWRRRRRCCCCSLSTLPTPPSPLPAVCGGAPSSWKASDGAVRLRYCHAFFPAVSLSVTSALNLLTSSRIMLLWPCMAAMWRGVWPLVDLAFMSKATPTFWTPYLKATESSYHHLWCSRGCLWKRITAYWAPTMNRYDEVLLEMLHMYFTLLNTHNDMSRFQ